MKIVDLQVMKGPNFWSVTQHRILVFKIEHDDESAIDVENNELLNKFERLLQNFDHDSSADKGVTSLPLSTDLNSPAAIIAHLSIVLQRACGLQVNFSEWAPVRQKGTCRVIVEYVYERAGRLAAEYAVKIINQLMTGELPETGVMIDHLRSVIATEQPHDLIAAIMFEARQRGIPCRIGGADELWLGYGKMQQRYKLNKEEVRRLCAQPDSAAAMSRFANSLLNELFPAGHNGRIPLVAVTGTNGKTTTTRLVAHLAIHAGGHRVGYTTTDGIYKQEKIISRGDCTGPLSSQTVLSDQDIDFAVLEVARGGILRSGLFFSECDISVVTNVSADHLGLKDIDTLEDMAKVKAVVPRSTRPGGCAILNADNDLVYEMRSNLSCKVALFSMEAGTERIARHIAEGGLAAVLEEGQVIIYDRGRRLVIADVTTVPVTLGGKAAIMIKNLLPAILVSWLCEFDLQKVRLALSSFRLTPDQAPGRMNIFDFGKFRFMVDYAHNFDGIRELAGFLENTGARVNVGIIGIAGDRRDEDIRAFGNLCARVFNKIIIRHDVDMRGRSKEEMTKLLKEGITEAGRQNSIEVISSEAEAIKHAIEHAEPNAFITVCTENVYDTLNLVIGQHTRYLNNLPVNTWDNGG